MRNSVFKPRSYDRMVNFCSPKVTFCVNFIPTTRCRICRDLRVFIGVKFSLEDLLRVKDLTFRNSATTIVLIRILVRSTFKNTHASCVDPGMKDDGWQIHRGADWKAL